LPHFGSGFLLIRRAAYRFDDLGSYKQCIAKIAGSTSVTEGNDESGGFANSYLHLEHELP